MPRKVLCVRRSLVVMLSASLVAAGSALAAGSTLTVKGPGKTVAPGKGYEVTAAGTAVGGAKTLDGLEGSSGIKCKATYARELSAYQIGPNSADKFSVSGHFTKTFQYTNNGSGPKVFCAYLTNQSGSVTYAHSSAEWTNK